MNSGTLSLASAIEIAQRGFSAWAAKPHNAKWFRRIDGTPIPNDLVVCIADAFAGEPLIGATGKFPQGQLNDADEGELQMGVAYDPIDGIVRLAFGTPVSWIGLPPPEARQLAALLLQNAAKGGS